MNGGAPKAGMRRYASAILLLLFAGSALLRSAAASMPSPELAEAQIRALDRRLIEAFFVDDFSFVAALAAPDLLYMGPDGAWLPREEFLTRFQRAEPFKSTSSDEVRIQLFGTVAVVNGLFTGVHENDQITRVRYTDVYAWQESHWRLINAQNTALAVANRDARNSRVAPVPVPWTDQREEGVTTAQLRALNEGYVQAFRTADVAWYDRHLAPNYSAIYGDGTLRERAAALLDFAQPEFAQHLRSFPVGAVKVRRFGDIALIHAENVYERQDGRKGINRYTDIWWWHEGRWQCVAAHITVHRAAA